MCSCLFDVLIQFLYSYVTWANYGGKLELDIFTDSTFVSEMTQQWMTTQHELDFHFNLYDIDPSASTAGYV